MRREFPLKEVATGIRSGSRPILSDPQIFSEPQFRFIEDVFEAAKAGEGKLRDRDRADFSDWGLIQRGATAFFMDQYQHQVPFD
jgi:hypothetical protein